ncbi:hypothetical protein WR25_22252 [Diploscapter pachys]|uniref:Uncharacterized protein n=1 Tax=Diploscapter pachys TaxID=2018661 RepID=A0A2A2K0R9_9BILA|nr:hypothetical protein WR25_22252 [Diploscapter pachys]
MRGIGERSEREARVVGLAVEQRLDAVGEGQRLVLRHEHMRLCQRSLRVRGWHVVCHAEAGIIEHEGISVVVVELVRFQQPRARLFPHGRVLGVRGAGAAEVDLRLVDQSLRRFRIECERPIRRRLGNVVAPRIQRHFRKPALDHGIVGIFRRDRRGFGEDWLRRFAIDAPIGPHAERDHRLFARP